MSIDKQLSISKQKRGILMDFRKDFEKQIIACEVEQVYFQALSLSGQNMDEKLKEISSLVAKYDKKIEIIDRLLNE